MRTHGWNGSPPKSDDEARARIVAATMACVDRYGAKTGLADVATELGVTRQTVYRYFPTTEQLFRATGAVAAKDLIDRVVSHVADLVDPAEVIIEAMVFCLDQLPNERYLSLLPAVGRRDILVVGATSPTAMELGRRMYRRLPINWEALGYRDRDIDGLVELMLRLLQSFIADPGHPARSPAEQREYLRRWVAPVIVPIRVGVAT
ncbi:MAG: TetR/AcrR family transcriptional regulator [Actinobacteria bacterium]|nr:MAG: TetR/AcrR family transcriptional regulator [Actinomycetota bacterium]